MRLLQSRQMQRRRMQVFPDLQRGLSVPPMSAHHFHLGSVGQIVCGAFFDIAGLSNVQNKLRIWAPADSQTTPKTTPNDIIHTNPRGETQITQKSVRAAGETPAPPPPPAAPAAAASAEKGTKTTFKSPPAQKGPADGHTVSNAPDLF